MLPRGRLPPVAGFFSRAALRTVSIHDIKGYASASVAECGGLINKKGLEEKIAVQRWAISLTTSNRAIQAADSCVRFLGDRINESTRCLRVW